MFLRFFITLRIFFIIAIAMVIPVVLYAQRVVLSKDSPSSNYIKGVQEIETGNIDRGIGLLKLAAGKGHVEAECMLGDIYYEGKVTKQDYEEAGYWYSVAAKNGNAQAIAQLAILIAEKKYVPRVKENLNGEQVQIINYNITSGDDNKKQNMEGKDSRSDSDVDVNIPHINIENKGTIVIIIANEHYQEEADVEYANNDGEIFKEYCVQTLGIPVNQIRLRKDATLNNIYGELEWLQEIMKTEKFKNNANILFYYAGHGIPDEASGSTYLLPVDGRGNRISTGYSMKKLYDLLNGLPANNVTVFIDACFSGSKRGDGMLMAARGVKIKPKESEPYNNLTIFSAATGDETAYPYKLKRHGLFTYYLLKKLQESKGTCSYGELGDYIQEQVKSISLLENGKIQTPTVSSGEKNWRKYKFK